MVLHLLGSGVKYLTNYIEMNEVGSTRECLVDAPC